MKTWRVVAGTGIEGLTLGEEAHFRPGPGQVRVRVRAVTLNFRDLLVVRGLYPVGTTEPMVPGSDAAGEVIEVGSAVTRFKAGDRVSTSFFPNWVDGPMTRTGIAGPLGGGGHGTLTEEIVLDEAALVPTPKHLDFAQGAALTCAGTTAWNALFVSGDLKPGSTVLLLGTGGVSIWALQLAKAAGLRVIITSSSDQKLARARAMGADAGINYLQLPDWGTEVKKLTEGEGVDLVLEVGGEKTFAQSLASVRMQGSIMVIGGVTGMGGTMVPRQLVGVAVRMQGVYVGSRAMHEDLARFVAVAEIKPVIDSVFPAGEAPDAFRYFATGKHFGKVALSFA
ncbi:MAG: NAD(P)-dependent alcohol dehydrogenase [Pseudomonadota bacterium]